MVDHLFVFLKERVFRHTGAVFALNALLFALWVTRLPEIKNRLGLGEAELGMALFFAPIGAMIAMFSVSQFIRRYGAGTVTLATAFAYVFAMVPPFGAANLWQLCGALFLVGLTTGAMDISMNAVAAILQRDRRRVIMATCHGFFSLGGMIGAGLGSLFLGLGWPAWIQVLLITTVSVSLLAVRIRPSMTPIRDGEAAEGTAWAWPGKALLALSVIGFCSMQGEGAIVDWSAIYLNEVARADTYMWGLGYAGFSLSMTVGRFLGDGITERLGVRTIMPASFGIVIAGLSFVLIGRPWLSVFGFTLAGAGYALLVPIVFSQAAKTSATEPSKGIAAVASMGYLGFLLGPVLIGGIAEVFDLRGGFSYLIGLMLAAMLVSWVSFSKRSVSRTP